jgi:lipid-binding SYLF domain-containing protein
MRLITLAATLAVLLFNPVPGGAFFDKDDPDKQRNELQEARTKALNKLYQERPSLKGELSAAKGYAVFSSIGVNLLLVSTERGGGILRDNVKDQDVYMKMFSAGGGWGMGVKDFALIFVFHTQEAMDLFQDEGWDFSGQAEAGAQSGGKGGGTETAVTVVPGTSIYQLTEAGLALQATLKGTKFWRDEELN